ncbi:MAG: 2,3-bisphosphoglycerate-independent phosphoglycerate mutase [Deltaproteobacteria bacterium]|nr:2,3-bisphosphoglycerate-independent phosphoglycerate mutase [Deltaproteobacteria bacterium]
MDFELAKLAKFSGRKGPQLIVVMDGVGLGRDDEGNAVKRAYTPSLNKLFSTCPWTKLMAHGTAVGLPSDDDMGNSEVGHNAIGAGRVYAQGAKLVNEAISSGRLYEGEVWQRIIQQVKSHNTKLHFIGLLSDGNVHAHIDHLFALLRKSAAEGLKNVCVHPLLDGRDVDPTSALQYIEPLEKQLAEINAQSGANYRIASGGGRMLVTMDRYQIDWNIVKRGWHAHVLGKGRSFKSATEAITAYREENPGIQDQNLPEFVVVNANGQPLGPIEDGDGVIFYNFRGDRSIEISLAFEEQDFPYFDRERLPQVCYAGMMQYDGDLHIPKSYLVNPPTIENTMGEYLARNQIRQFACSETQKYGHVTYFWNGNRSGMFDEKFETYLQVDSDIVPFEQRPWMKAAEITDATIKAVLSGKYQQIRINLPNGDMVGHTGNFAAAVIAVSTVDLCLARLLEAVNKVNGVALITADHGNADEMYEYDKKKNAYKRDERGELKPLVSHTLNPVPFIIYDSANNGDYEIVQNPAAGLANIAATAFNLLGYEAPEGFSPSLVKFR